MAKFPTSHPYEQPTYPMDAPDQTVHCPTCTCTSEPRKRPPPLPAEERKRRLGIIPKWWRQ